MQTHIPNNLVILSLSQCCSYGKRETRRYFILYEQAQFEWNATFQHYGPSMHDTWPLTYPTYIWM